VLTLFIIVGEKMKKVISATIIVLLLTSVLLFSSDIRPVRAPATIIVPDDYATIQAAINAANDGDTIYVRNGTYYENVVVNKTVSLCGENSSNTIIDGNETADCVQVTAVNVRISDFTIRNGGARPYTAYSSIRLSSNGNSIVNDNLIGSWCGVWIEQDCDDNSIINNVIEGNLNGIAGQLWHNSNITHNTIRDNLDGIWIGPYSDNNIISFNDITGQGSAAIGMWQSSNNIFEGNNITGGIVIGFQIGFSSGNRFFHNNIANKGKQIDLEGQEEPIMWDNGYPSGGNYWSDYNGTDLFSGPYQNITGADGIGDTPYVIDSNNTDHYPLMQPWTGMTTTPPLVHDVAVTNVTVVVPHCLSNVGNGVWVFQGLPVYVNVTVLNKGDFDENVTVTLYYNMTANEMIGAQNVTLSPGQNETVAFVWDTASVPYNQNYTMTAVATIPIDNNPADNTLACGPITVRIMGDINGDGTVDGKDISILAKSFGSCGPNYLYQGSPPSPTWNLDADLNGDNVVDGRDLVLVARNFGK
jgi:parallel beta-helix repeat protein